MIIIGLTGSIGMGKSTTAQMFVDEGIAVHDADQVVHKLYHGHAATLIEQAFPGTTNHGVVDRDKLGAKVFGDPKALAELEQIVHPLVRKEEQGFLDQAKARRADMVVLDIPLLFETGGHHRVDRIVVVTTNADEQQRRVLQRQGMTKEKFANIKNRQVADEQKRAKADFLVDTSEGIEAARHQVREIIKKLRTCAT